MRRRKSSNFWDTGFNDFWTTEESRYLWDDCTCPMMSKPVIHTVGHWFLHRLLTPQQHKADSKYFF